MRKMLILFLILMPSAFFGAGTVDCTWKAGYFNASYWTWYGHGFTSEKQRVVKEVMIRSWIIIKLDSVIRFYKKANKLAPFPHWTLIDKSGYNTAHQVCVKGNEAYLDLADSSAVHKALSRLWGIKACTLHISEPSGLWLYALHYQMYENRLEARRIPDIWMESQNANEQILWLSITPDEGCPNQWYQHETDGFYHRYYGLFLTYKDVLRAQEWFLEKYGRKTIITSQYLTPGLLKSYAAF